MRLIEMILALLTALSTQAGPSNTVARVDPDTAPWGVTPAEQPGTVYEDGTIVWEDGSTGCVTASPCDFAQAGYVPGEPPPGDVDPVWDRPELRSGERD